MKTVRIYNGSGVSPQSLKQTESTVKTFLPHLAVEFIGPQEIIDEDWASDTALLIIPGGADLPYDRALRGAGNSKIKEFVEGGGKFLGLCAGAYYGAKRVEFDLGMPLEVVGDRELSFFPGTAVGPAFGPGTFNYENESGACVAKLDISDKSAAHVHFNGGCYFKDAHNFDDVNVIAFYADIVTHPAAIVSCKVGEGRAVLCGPHPEYDPKLMNQSDLYLQKIIPILVEYGASRNALLQLMFSELAI